MVEAHAHHDKVLDGLWKELKPIFEFSTQGVYLYLDDVHLVANKRFLQMVGHKNICDLAGGDFLDQLVAPSSRKTLVTAYRKAVEKLDGSKITVVWKKKGGGTVKTSVLLVPITYQGHAFTLHFVER